MEYIIRAKVFVDDLCSDEDDATALHLVFGLLTGNMLPTGGCSKTQNNFFQYKF